MIPFIIKEPFLKRRKDMKADLVFILLVFSILAIIFVISKLNRAIKLLNNRVNMHSNVLKKMRKELQGDSLDAEDAIKNILDHEFK